MLTWDELVGTYGGLAVSRALPQLVPPYPNGPPLPEDEPAYSICIAALNAFLGGS